MYTEEEFYSEELALSDEEKLDYVKNLLEIKNQTIYGQVVFIAANAVYITPYDVYGTKAQIFRNPKYRWGIKASKIKELAEEDYVQGELSLHNGRLTIVNIKKMNSASDFMESLTKMLRKNWEEEGFTFDEKDFKKFNGKMAFSSWVTDKVEAMLEGKYEAFIQEKIDDKIKEKEQLEGKIKEDKLELEGIKTEKEKEELELENMMEELKKAEDRYNHYKELGIILEKQPIKDTHKAYKYTSYEELINQVWGYLWKKKELFYEKSTIRTFMNALRTKQLILLWGRPGSGKTSLPMKAAQALGAKCIRIQVQSNWSDNQDLIGFYNVVDKRYVATRFLDTLIEAEENPEQLYIILLDEMNLSNVEYYFSEMLNVFTWDINKEYELHLYSERVRERAFRELQRAEQEGKDISELAMQLADMEEYRPIITVPKNVRFVGTLNSDATTKTISPKVTDRSCLIELQTISKEMKETESNALSEELALNEGTVWVKAEYFEVSISKEGRQEELLDVVNEIRKYGVAISNRTNMYIQQWTGWSDTIVDLEEIILTKVLPAIDYDYDDPQTKKMLAQLKKEFSIYDKIMEKLNRMEKYAKKTGRLTYWED